MIGTGGEQRVGGAHGVREGGGSVRGRRRRRGVLLKQNMPTGHVVDCYLWFDFLLFYSIKFQICVSLKGNACTENKVVI